MRVCEWDPVQQRASWFDLSRAARPSTVCKSQATIDVGGVWALCATCAAHPDFKFYRKHAPLRDTKRIATHG